jgi:hypothetical protein
MRTTRRAFLFLALLVGSASSVAAWTPESQRQIGEQAARLVPPDLYRQLVRNRPSYRIGIEEPFQRAVPEDRFKYPDGSGRLDEVVHVAIQNAIASIRAHRPFNEVAYRLGLVAHYVASLNNPIHTAYGDPRHQTWAADYLRYAESVAPRLKWVFYGFEPNFDPDRRVAETLQRSRRLYPMLGREYARIGYRSGVVAFDDRSTAYAVAALGYSHAVSDIAETLRYIWLTAGGIDSRQNLPIRGRQWVRLSPLGDDARRAR